MDLLNKFDLDNNGLINYNEFIISQIENTDKISKQQLRSTFDYFDTDKNGFITANEVTHIIGI